MTHLGRHALFLLAVVAAVGFFTSRPGTETIAAESPAPSESRTFEFIYQVHFPAAPGATGPVHLWIPSPAPGVPYQAAPTNLSITGDVQRSVGHDPEYGDEFIVFSPTPAQVASGFDAGLRFTTTRQEYVTLHDGAVVRKVSGTTPSPAVLQRYLQRDKMVPLDGVIADLARQQTAGAQTPLEKARKIYDYVVSTMHYDKSGEGWGRGDALWACDSKRGNCTDFHSLFIGMMRSSGIPARFEIGFQIPEGKSEGDIPGYHCWSEFYIQGIGWIPVDASEAAQHLAKKDYFFGALDPNRVLFTYGRDIRLSADQKGDPLNYFIYPYAELNGQPVKNLEKKFSFRDTSSSQRAASGR
jgi:hypothetical protein